MKKRYNKKRYEVYCDIKHTFYSKQNMHFSLTHKAYFSLDRYVTLSIKFL